MIKLKLSFGKEQEQSFEIEHAERLDAAIKRIFDQAPVKIDPKTTMNVVVNGHLLSPEYWPSVKLEAKDEVLITPKIKDGDGGQVFKQVLLIAVAAVATAVVGPAVGGGIYGALAATAVTIAATLAINALIPPPVPEQGGFGGGGEGLEGSQMYSISGQSNVMKRLGVVPKVYGTHRVFPTLAAVPYTEISVNPQNGETIQYLVAIYDFGLGTPQLTDIKIGDTPLSYESFDDFEYNLVDINRPEVPADDFDVLLKRSFTLYKGDRVSTQLSIDLGNGEESIQNADENTNNKEQEIIVDFICPVGLYGMSSWGQLGERRVKLLIDFAPVNSNDWKPYNDLSAVDSYKIVGGTDLTRSFYATFAPIAPDDPLYSTYYDPIVYDTGNQFTEYRYITMSRVRNIANPRKILMSVPAAGFEWNVGSPLFYQDLFIGLISSVADVGGYKEITLDRNLVDGLMGHQWRHAIVASVPVYQATPEQLNSIRSTVEEASSATIVGDKTSPVYASFRFKPKAIGQFKVRVRRVNAEGDFSTSTGDNTTWSGLSSAYNTEPVVTDKRHVFMELRIRATNQLNGNIQNLSAVAAQVVDIYDEDTETWSRGVSSNPAWVFVDLLTGEVNKKAVSKDRLHLPSILEWKEYCDVVPDPPPDSEYTAPRFQCNFLLDYEATLQSVLQQVAGAAQASLNIIDGKYGVLVDRLKTVPVQIFTPRNSRDFSSERFYGVRPHAVKVKYIDPARAWELSEEVVYDDGYDEDTATEFDELTAFACTNREQAWRFGRYMIAQNKLRQETMTILVDFENIVCTRGDYVQFVSDVMQVGGTPARVKSVSGVEVEIDDALDIDSSLNYGCTWRTPTGEMKTAEAYPISSTLFTLVGRDVVFPGDTTGYTMDAYYRHGGIPAPIGTQKKDKAVAGVFSGGNTEYTPTFTPISSEEILVFLNGIMRSEWTLVSGKIRFTGLDTTSQVCDIFYRHNAGGSTTGTLKQRSLVGTLDGADTVFTLPEAPLDDDHTLVWINSVMRTDYTLSGTEIRFVGMDLTDEAMETQYRHAGGSSPIGSGKHLYGLTGTYDALADETTYELEEGPISAHDLLVFFNGRLEIEYDLEGEVPAVGDLIVVGEVGNLVLDCIVKAISPNDDMSAQIVLIERANGIFDYESSLTLPEYDPQLSNTTRPDFSPPAAVVNLTLESPLGIRAADTKSGYTYYANISWNVPPKSVYEFFEIWADDGRGYRAVAQTANPNYTYQIDQQRLGYPHGLKVVAVASSGRKLQLVEMPEVTFTPEVKSTPPSDVASLAMSITNEALQLSWPSISDEDVAKYELRYSPDVNDVWEASVPLQVVDRNVNSISVQARTGVYFIKAIDFAGNKSASAATALTTIPNLFNLNVIETLNDAPDFDGEKELTELLGEAVILQTRVAGDSDTMQFYEEGFYYVIDTLDLGDIYSVRLQSLIRADGYRFGELMSETEHLSELESLNSADSDDWSVMAQYRATNEILTMSDTDHLSDLEHLNDGVGEGFTEWRDIPTTGDATGRVFQFRVKLQSLTPNVTPRLFDATIQTDMPDRLESFENLTSHPTDAYQVTYSKKFHGPSPSPNVQITIDDGQTGDYWEFENKNLEGFQIRIYDKDGIQVSRQFDVHAKGYGHRHTVAI